MSTAERLRRLLLALCLSPVLAVPGCLRIEVDPVLMQPVPAIPDPAPGAPLAEIQIRGQDMDRPDWAKALTISRFFYTRVENTSGSPQELLSPALTEVLRQRGYRTTNRTTNRSTAKNAASGADAALSPRSAGPPRYVFEVNAERNLLLWLPPREFIQTPRPRARGVVRIDVLYRSRLLDGEKTLWDDRFISKQELTVLPGEEDSALTRAATQTFQDYLRQIQINLPRPRLD